MQRHGLFGDARGVFQKVQLIDKLVPFQLMLATEGIWKRTLLDFPVSKAIGSEARAGGVAGLVDHAPQRGGKNLMISRENEGRLCKRDARIAPQLLVDRIEQRQIPIY